MGGLLLQLHIAAFRQGNESILDFSGHAAGRVGEQRGELVLKVISTVCLLIPGVATGGLAGSLLWERVAATLMESVNVQIPLESNMAVLAPILAFGITALMVAITFMVSVMVSGSKGLMRRK